MYEAISRYRYLLEKEYIVKLITSTKELRQTFSSLAEKYKNIAFATAWASAGHPAFKKLIKHKSKIQHSTIGLHFYQTDPEVLVEFQKHKNIKFILQTDGVFHPKVYLFWNTPTDWELLSGSANFTKGAFDGSNQEMMLLAQGQSSELFKDLIRFLVDDCFAKAKMLNEQKIKRYGVLYQERQKQIRTLSNCYAKDKKERRNKTDILSTSLLTLSWEDYFKKIRKNEYHLFTDRLDLLSYAKEFFQDKAGFLSRDLESRKLISGLPNNAKNMKNLGFGLFGTTRSNGKFFNLIKDGNLEIAYAIDEIPLVGEISKSDFLKYIKFFQKVGYDNPLGVATRLLTMKRPDLFFCFNNANKEGICKELGLSKNIDAERYWDEILLPIYDTAWFNSDKPVEENIQKAWLNRVALIDCIYYKPRNDK